MLPSPSNRGFTPVAIGRLASYQTLCATPLAGRMKKQTLRRKAAKKKFIPKITPGRVVRELVLWEFSGNEDLIRHNAGELAKALLMSYNLDNFGPTSFGLEEEE